VTATIAVAQWRASKRARALLLTSIGMEIDRVIDETSTGVVDVKVSAPHGSEVSECSVP